jgi:subtilase family serine protease
MFLMFKEHLLFPRVFISMKNTSKYSKIELTSIIQSSFGFSEVIRKLTKKEKVHGGMVDHIKKLAIQYEIDFTHFKKNAWNKGLKSNKSLTIDDLKKNYLLLNSPKKTCNWNIKNWLIKFNHLENKCQICGCSDIWNSMKLTLQMDHIDGNNLNNELSNLRLLCPNCHSQTINYAGKANKK